MLNLYIANLGKYNEGYLVGDWIELPFSENELNDLFARIGLGKYINGEYVHGVEVDGGIYEEYAIHDVETDIEGLYSEIGEYSSLSKLNDIADSVNGLSNHDQKKINALLEWGVCDNIFQAIKKIEEYHLMEEIGNEFDLGYYWIEESGCYDIPKFLQGYIDYEKFGRDITFDGRGFMSSHGWLEVC